MVEKSLVSLLIPAYNSASFINLLLDSILEQDYPNIETIIIDDGSTDKTKEVILSYREKFKARNFSLIYSYQENQGQSVAINNALKLYQGKYVAWPDSDDYYSSPESINRMVTVLENSEENVAGVFTDATLTDGTVEFGKRKYTRDLKYIFKDCLTDTHSFIFNPVCYLFKSDKLKDAIKGDDIYTTKHAGQNWQLYLPTFHKYKIVKIEGYLATIYVRRGSHSNGHYGRQKDVLIDAYYKTLCGTVPQIDMDDNERAKIMKFIYKKYDNEFSKLYFSQQMFEKLREKYKQFPNHKFKSTILYYLSYLPPKLLKALERLYRHKTFAFLILSLILNFNSSVKI